MKRLLLCCLWLVATVGAIAQVPSFKSFNTNQFSTNNFIVSIKDGALMTNITVRNSITLPSGPGSEVTLTNVYSLSYWTNIATVLQPGGDTVINSVQVTNLTAFQTLASAGAFVLDATLATTLSLGTNCVSALQEGGLALSGPTSDPADTTFNIDGGNFSGHLMFILNASNNSGFTFLNGSAFCDGTPGAFVRLNGDWITQTKGDGLLLYNFNGSLWTEVGRFSGSTNIITGDNVWENVLAGNIQPVHGNENNVLHFTSGLSNNSTNIAMVVGTTNLWSASGSLLAAFQNAGTNNLLISADGAITSGRNSAAIWGAIAEGALRYLSLQNVSAGDSEFFEWVLGSHNAANFTTPNSRVVFSGSTNQATVSVTSDTGPTTDSIVIDQNALLSSIKIKNAGSDVLSFQPDITSTGSSVAHFLDTSNVQTNGDTFLSIRNAGTPLFQFAPAEAGNPSSQIVWGPGTTNVLSRSGNNLVYTNGSTSSVYLEVRSGAAATATGKFGVSQSANTLIQADTGRAIQFGPNAASEGYLITTGGFAPSSSGNALGSATANSQWQQLYLESTGRISWNGTTNTVYDVGVSNTPEGATTADPGSIARDWVNGAAYVKASGSGNTGWQRLATTGTGSTVQAEYLDADETNDTVTPDNLALSATVSAAGEYAFTLTVFLDNSTDADGAVIDFNGGDATMTSFRAQAKAFDTALVLSTQTTTLDGDISVTTLTGAGSIEVSGGFTVNAAGTFIPRFFMEADSGGTLTAFRNSTLIVTAAN